MAKTQTVWKERPARWREGGKTIEEFAERAGVKPSSLKWWRWRLEGAQGKAPTSVVPDPGTTFVEVDTGATARTSALAAAEGRFEVLLGNGRLVRVPVDFDDRELARVLFVAEGGRR